MTSAVYIAIFLHFARKTIRKISESKEDRAKSLVARMGENGVKIYRDMYADMPFKVAYVRRRIFTVSEPEPTIGNPKSAYDILNELVKNQCPGMPTKQ